MLLLIADYVDEATKSEVANMGALKMLVDVCEQIKPALSFTDSIVCMEGDGA